MATAVGAGVPVSLARTPGAAMVSAVSCPAVYESSLAVGGKVRFRHQPLIEPLPHALSSTTYRLHVPLALPPASDARVAVPDGAGVPYGPAGAGDGKTS